MGHPPVYRRFIELLQEVDGRLVDHCIALIFLHFTELIEQGQENSEILKVINSLMEFEESRVSRANKELVEFHGHLVHNGNEYSDET